MKTFRILLLIHLFSMTVYAQVPDSTRIHSDTIQWNTSNAFFFPHSNYETFNNSFITGNSDVVIRSEDNPRLFVDGIPMNPRISNNLPFAEYLGSMNLLSYDIEKVTLNTLVSNNKINAGQYNNSIDFNTSGIQLGKTAPQWEVNNFSAFAYQDIETMGYTTVTNVNLRQSFKKLGFRASVSNGYMNDYLPENGLQRYSGNLKMKYQPITAISLTGFFDYSNFQDFKREEDQLDETMYRDDFSSTKGYGSGKNTLKVNRIFTYINADVRLTKGLSMYGKWALHSTADNTERYIFSDIRNLPIEPSIGYFESNDYKFHSNYTDVGVNFIQSITKNALIGFNIGYSQNDTQYDSNYQNYFILLNGSLSRCIFNAEPQIKEKVYYTSVKWSNKFISVHYLFDRSNNNGNVFFSSTIDKTFNNHLLSTNVDIIKNNFKAVNRLGLRFNLGKLNNYAILSPPDYTIYANNNLELMLYSSFLKDRLNVNLSFYQKVYDKYAHLFDLQFYNGSYHHVIELGKVTKEGYDLNGSVLIVKKKTLDWLLSFSYSGNSAELSNHKNFGLVIVDTLIQNTLISVVNSVRYKNFKVGVALEGKEGYDVNLYKNNLSVAEPLPYWEQSQVIGVNKEGVSTIERIENWPKYITATDYFMLKHIGIEYELNNSSGSVSYIIGAQYDKSRRLYYYINDARRYPSQFQRPSFYNMLSISFKVRF